MQGFGSPGQRKFQRAGELNRKVTVERLAATPDGQGGSTENWTTFATPWARAEPIGGQEALVNDTLRSSQGWRVTVRYRTDLTVADRVKLRDSGRDWTLNILSIVDTEGRRERIVLLCDGKPT